MHWYPIPGFPSTRPKPSAPQKLRPESMKADVLFTTPAAVCVWPPGHVFWIPIIVEPLLGGRVTGTSRSQQPSCIHGLGWEGAKEPWSAWLCPELFQGEGIRALCITWVLVSWTGTALGDLTSEVCWTCCRKKQTHLSSGRMAAEVRCSKRSSAPSFLWKRKLQPKPIVAQTLKNKVLPSLLSLTIPVRETLCLEAQKQGVRWTPSAPCGHSSLCSQLIYTCSTNSTDPVPGTGQDTQGAHKDPTEYEQGWAEPPDTRIHPLRSRSKWRPGWEGSGRFRAGAPAGLGCSSRVWCLAGAFIRWKGRVEKDWGLQLFFLLGHTTPYGSKGFLNGNNTTQPPSVILLTFNHCFQKQILKAEESFRSQGRILWKARDHFSACQSTLPASTSWGEPNHLLTTQCQRHTYWTASLRAGLPCFTQPNSSCARPTGGCSAGSVVSSSIRHTFTLCQCCLFSYHTTPGRIWGIVLQAVMYCKQ